MEDEQRLTMFSWEMALRLALDQLEFAFYTMKKNGFSVIIWKIKECIITMTATAPLSVCFKTAVPQSLHKERRFE